MQDAIAELEDIFTKEDNSAKPTPHKRKEWLL